MRCYSRSVYSRCFCFNKALAECQGMHWQKDEKLIIPQASIRPWHNAKECNVRNSIKIRPKQASIRPWQNAKECGFPGRVNKTHPFASIRPWQNAKECRSKRNNCGHADISFNKALAECQGMQFARHAGRCRDRCFNKALAECQGMQIVGRGVVAHHCASIRPWQNAKECDNVV